MSARSADFVAVDLGASSGRVLLGRFDGERFALGELHRFANEPVETMGHVHWDVLRLWRDVRLGLAAYREVSAAPPAGVGVDTWGVDYALLDERGALLGNPYHYRDARNDGVPERVFARVPRERVYARTGVQVMQINTLYQLAGAVERSDPQLACARTLLMMPDLFHYWLTGRRAAEVTQASTSQMLDATTRRWAVDLLDDLGLPSRLLPELVAPGTVLGGMREGLWRDLGLGGPAPVIAAGSHDTASAVAAVPDLDEGSAYISSGTWSLVGMELREPILGEEARRLNFTNEGGVAGTVRFLKNVAGLWLLQESRRQWRREGDEHDWDDLLALAERAEPFRSLLDPDHGDFLGHGDMPGAVRAYCARTAQPEPQGPGELARCCLESLALRYRWVIEALEALTGRRVETIRVVGGGSRNALLNRFTADACARPVVAGPVEATALGNVMMQAVATGRIPDLAAGRRAVAASVERTRFEPGDRRGWDEAYERFRALPGVAAVG